MTIQVMEKITITLTEESETNQEQHLVHADYFFDNKGIDHKKFVPPSQTVNFAVYV